MVSVQNSPRLQLENRLLSHPQSYVNHGQDVIVGLQQYPKTLPPHYFYDDRGSLLFEQICLLPEYYPTRTEASILQAIAKELVQITGACDFIELGSGSSTKTRILLDAFAEENIALRYIPVDVSEAILKENAEAILATYPQLTVRGLVSTYQLALASLPHHNYPHRLMAFLGSSLGNFSADDCQDFFEQVGQALDPGDYFLLGVDLCKPVDILEAAYNDVQGVTAEFNLNMLRHLNWRFQGNFALDNFFHRAIFNQQKSQIEMYLRSGTKQAVRLENLGLTINFQAGETILTEISCKFSLQANNPNAITRQLADHGLEPLQVWTDDQQWFAVILSQVN
ncbi:L-histidine N(alpha)-methyltransferase [Synechocystis sp. PCC 7339]|uniref:L-histidine N(alpha)-methyltransferase n=1 Tax=unclassified Synechocystis TaxID=2640012 RepID=UPI001BB0D286|nr:MULTISPECIES: L-histidine N(alpha)-methyltransferase [unclassified Synechocystis]QUS62096.1 L-histidine N(alpha)-methyltransferase [Synechocystis sp. PCC 7338]UAJ74296.1 L-histidine N(alpha)-methyltransferase [Synechocystis sp. PCC 7339]